MEKLPKFIIEGDNLILMKVSFHHEIVTDKANVKGGGWYKYIKETNMFVFYGDSHDFGQAKFEDIENCIKNEKIFSDNRLYRNISRKHRFGYDTGSEIIELNIFKKGDKVKMSESYKKSLIDNDCKEHVDEFGDCEGYVEDFVNYNKEGENDLDKIGPEVNVRWQPSGLRYGYDPNTDLVKID